MNQLLYRSTDAATSAFQRCGLSALIAIGSNHFSTETCGSAFVLLPPHAETVRKDSVVFHRLHGGARRRDKQAVRLTPRIPQDILTSHRGPDRLQLRGASCTRRQLVFGRPGGLPHSRLSRFSSPLPRSRKPGTRNSAG